MNLCFDIIPYQETLKQHQPHYAMSYTQEKIKTTQSSGGRSDKFRKNRKKVKKPRNFWSSKEEGSYLEFLMSNIEILKKNLQERRKFCINLMMSKAVQTRNKRQCHSHHQKMMQKYGSLEKIIFALSNKLNCSYNANNLNITQGQQNQTTTKMKQVASDHVYLQQSSEDSQTKNKTPQIDFYLESIQLYFEQFSKYSNYHYDLF